MTLEQEVRHKSEWSEAEDRLLRTGRLSRVKHPSPAQARGETVPH